MSDVKFFKCTKCANMFVKVIEGPCTPVCCGEPCVELEAGSTDAATEKHVPAVTREGGKIIAKVGEVAHPMLDAHFIQFVALATEDRLEIKKLKPGEEPVATFACDGAENVTIYEYCNLHGLWKAEI
ncbi:MAG: desulfoferrodoxin family protein [Atopobiaceae bacterium]|nr:desulfoferrodoxin family protein [Atopobiaceae bacterium]